MIMHDSRRLIGGKEGPGGISGKECLSRHWHPHFNRMAAIWTFVLACFRVIRKRQSSEQTTQ
jgi:hypothetical protein